MERALPMAAAQQLSVRPQMDRVSSSSSLNIKEKVFILFWPESARSHRIFFFVFYFISLLPYIIKL